MNHARIAAAALRFRWTMVHDPRVDLDMLDVDRAADCAVSCGDPEIDGAIRRLGETWVRAGLDPARMCEPWRPHDARRLLDTGGSAVIDALDEIARGARRRPVLS